MERCGLDVVVVSCEYGNEPSDSMQGGEFIDQVSDYKLLKEDSAPWISLYYKVDGLNSTLRRKVPCSCSYVIDLMSIYCR
jgi:hypothetical protein